MTLFVVDSSVVIKWFTPEALSAEANRSQTAWMSRAWVMSVPQTRRT
jgi:predicted nucleic acid-binding protein